MIPTLRQRWTLQSGNRRVANRSSRQPIPGRDQKAKSLALRLFALIGALLIACGDGSSRTPDGTEAVAKTEAKLEGDCTSLTATVTSSRPTQSNWWTSSVGSTITITPTAAGCSSVQYQFHVQRPGQAWTMLADYGAQTSYVWNTANEVAGTYNFEIRARKVGSTAPYQAYYGFPFVLLASPTCTGVSASTSPIAPLAETPNMAAVGTNVTITSTATGCSSPKYRVVYLPPTGPWVEASPWSTNPSFVWPTAGKAEGLYSFQVWVRANDNTDYEWYTGFSYRLFASGITLSSAPYHAGAASSWMASVGTAVTFTAGSNPCTQAEYRFYHKAPNSSSWTMVQDYTPSPGGAVLPWNTTGAVPGMHQWQVWARGQGHTAVAYESYNSIAYDLLPNPMCDRVSLVPGPGTHSPVGTLVRLTPTTASCPSPRYRYNLSPVGGSWRTIQEWTGGKPAYWNTLLEAPGPYNLEAWARNSDSPVLYETYLSASYTLDAVTPTHGVSIGGGWQHNCELLANGQVGCWGYNGHGELGNGTTTSSASPVAVAGLVKGCQRAPKSAKI
ncbi:MAG: hypothetical protein ACOY0T_23000 [Myxococcota bacterium]